MSCNNLYQVPTLGKRLYSVWFRHIRVYCSNFFSNAFPPFFEPLIFLAGLGVGLGAYIQNMGNVNYVLFLASGLIVTSAMFTASFECTYGTFIRLEFDYIYDGMLGAPVSAGDLVVGELLFVATKGFFFSFAVLTVTWIAGIIRYPLSFLAPLVGFLTGLTFGSLALLVTSKINNINHFNFYFTGLISPSFFFSGVVFPLENLSPALRWVAELIPLTHVVRLARAVCLPNQLRMSLFLDFLYLVLFIGGIGFLAIRGLRKRLIQ
ncbi:MAG: ABC transporter permease [Bacteroidota bacterium]